MKAIISILLVIVILSCSSGENNSNIEVCNGVKYILNEYPMIRKFDQVIFKNLYSIDLENIARYNISDYLWMNVDKKNNLYVLDIRRRKIHIFDHSGTYIKFIGGSGPGRRDISGAENFFICNDMIYLYDRWQGIKIWDLNGEYIDFIRIKKPKNLGIFRPFKSYFLGLECRSKNNIYEREWSLDRYSKKLKHKNNITTLRLDLFNDPQFNPQNIVAVDSENNCYFPVKRDEYIINKYSGDGELLLSFGRKYKRIPYSDITRKIYNKNFKEAIGDNRFPALVEYPPIIRYIHVDEKDFIWVVIGEWNLDSSMAETVTTTIDIFSKTGKFLYTFDTTKFGHRSVIKNNRLYVPPTKDKNSIDAYSIIMNFSN